MTGCGLEVPDPGRRAALAAALAERVEDVCRHYAPSGARVEDCWEADDDGDGVSLRVFLTGPMRGSWTEAETGARGDALDLVAWLGGLDAAGALAEAERFLNRNAAGPEPEDAGGGQMALFGALPESRGRKRQARRSGKRPKAGTSRRTAAEHEPPSDEPVPRRSDRTTTAADATVRSQASPVAPAPEDRKPPPPAANPAQGAGDGPGGSGHPAPASEGAGFTADDRQRLRKAAEDAAWLRSRQTIRSLDTEAHGRARLRSEPHGRRWRRTGLEVVNVLALAAVWLVLGVAVENLYGVSELVAAYGAEFAEGIRVPPGRDGG